MTTRITSPLDELLIEDTWEVFQEFLNWPAQGDALNAEDFASDWVDELLEGVEWPIYEGDGSEWLYDNRSRMVTQVEDAIDEELGASDPVDEGEDALTDDGSISRLVIFGWLAA